MESDQNASKCNLSPSLSSPLLAIHSNTSFSDTEHEVPTIDSGFPTTSDGGEDAEPEEFYEEEELCSDNSDLFSLSPNLVPNPSSKGESLETSADYHSVLTFDASTSAIDKVSRDGEGAYIYSPTKVTERSKRTLSSWYQVRLAAEIYQSVYTFR